MRAWQRGKTVKLIKGGYWNEVSLSNAVVDYVNKTKSIPINVSEFRNQKSKDNQSQAAK